MGINPRCQVVDLAHEIPPHDVMTAALILGQTYHYFPEGTIHVVVVDPGVGGKRRPLVLESQHYCFVGPDNGVFDKVLRREQGIHCYELTESRYFLPGVSHTFHGRDVFAPVAAHLSLGMSPEAMGSPVRREDLVSVSIPEPTLDGDTLHAAVIHVDQFGNLITNVSRESMTTFCPTETICIEIGLEQIAGIKESYSEVEVGEFVALWGSGGLLEISLREKNLSRERGWSKGEPVMIRRNA